MHDDHDDHDNHETSASEAAPQQKACIKKRRGLLRAFEIALSRLSSFFDEDQCP
jgi:hypothetical protein